MNSQTAVKLKKPMAMPKIIPFNLSVRSKKLPITENNKKNPDMMKQKERKIAKLNCLLSEFNRETIIARPSGTWCSKMAVTKDEDSSWLSKVEPTAKPVGML